MFVAPWVQEALRVSPPTTLDDVEDHIVICGYSPRAETLIDEFRSWDREYAVIVRDREEALDLYERNITVVHGDPESADTLRNVHVEDADAVVADATDEQNASIALAVREVSDSVRIITLVENPDLTNYLQYAGADQVISPRHLLGHSLAEKVTASVTADLGETVTIGEDFEIVELSIQAGSEIDGTRLDESGVREQTGASIIGLWRRGEFQKFALPGDRTGRRHDSPRRRSGGTTRTAQGDDPLGGSRAYPRVGHRRRIRRSRFDGGGGHGVEVNANDGGRQSRQGGRGRARRRHRRERACGRPG